MNVKYRNAAKRITVKDEDLRLLRHVILRTWDGIAPDVYEAIGSGRHSDVDLLETCLDADHLTLCTQTDEDAREAERAVAILKPLYRDHGFAKVVRYLVKRGIKLS